ncbi:MAG: cytochrome c3 family protein, partial [Planctomycetia bacterium]|nr:cytochrome c3 family protein [Planctomycetia bacterium]
LELGAPLPHRDVQLVRDAMRSRLSEAFRTMQPADAASIQVTPRRIPGAAGSAPIRPGELDWVNQRLVSAEHVVFGKEAKGGCRFCHTLEERDSGLSVTPTAIPDRWQTHARFNHASHRLLDCGACHDRATGSTATAEILLPGIAICRECHGASASKSGQAGDRCVECHDYHDHGQDTLAGRLGLNLEPVGVRQRTSATADEAVQP